MWFDELGPPWPKHACFEDDHSADRLRTALTAGTETPARRVFGVVSETEVVQPGESGRIVVSCSDGSLVEKILNSDWDMVSVTGALVIVIRLEDQTTEFELRLVSTKIELIPKKPNNQN